MEDLYAEAEYQSVDQLLIAVHPRHAALYMRYMAFKRIGQRRDYSTVNGNPAVPLCLDLNEIRANRPPSWEKFFGEKIPREFLESQPISAIDRGYFLGLLPSERDPCERDPLGASQPDFYQEDVASEFNSDFDHTGAMLCV